MTAVDYRTASRTHVTPYTTDRRITGTPAKVAATIDQVRRSGRLVAMTNPRPTADGNVWVNVRFLTTPDLPTRQATDRRHPLLRTAGRIATVVIPVAGLTVGLIYAVSRLIAALIPLLPYLGVGLVLVLLLWAALGRAGVCAGLHCPGCSHGGHR